MAKALVKVQLCLAPLFLFPIFFALIPLSNRIILSLSYSNEENENGIEQDNSVF